MIEFRLKESEFTPGAWWIEFKGEIIRKRDVKLSKSALDAERWTPISSWRNKDTAEVAVGVFRRLCS